MKFQFLVCVNAVQHIVTYGHGSHCQKIHGYYIVSTVAAANQIATSDLAGLNSVMNGLFKQLH